MTLWLVKSLNLSLNIDVELVIEQKLSKEFEKELYDMLDARHTYNAS